MKIKIFLPLVFACIFTWSCKHHKSAPIVDRGNNFYGKNHKSIQSKYANIKTESSSDKPKKTPDIKREIVEETSNQPTQITVAETDTLYGISKKYNISLRNLIEDNKLSAPYSIKPGDHLIISSPTYYEVKNGDTLYSISRQYKMNVNDLVILNNLKEPYKLNTGQKIKVTSSKNEQSENKISTTSNDKKEDSLQSSSSQSESSYSLINKNNKFIMPVNGAIISKFGPKKGGLYNDGINIKAKEGASVMAAEDGMVAYVGNELKGYGNLIIIKHSGGWITAYAHLSKTNVKRSQKVKQKQIIALVGETGNVDAPQLYFGLRKGRDAVNPENYLKKNK